MNREIRFNAWLPELQYMLKDVAVGHGTISFPFIDEPEDEFYQFLKSNGFITADGEEDNFPEYLYDSGEDWCSIIDQKHFVLLQCTGLNDKNGKGINEGDILLSESKTNTVEVLWGVRNVKIKGFPIQLDDFEMHGWIVKNLNTNMIGELDISFYSGEVIGNKYQNSELINQ